MKRIFIIAVVLGLIVAVPVVLTYNANAADQTSFASALSGVHIKNYNRATPQLATSGAITPGAMAVLSGHGFKTVIDLRTDSDGVAVEKMEAEKAGIMHFNIPVNGAEGITQDQIDAFSKIYESAKKPVLLHCGSGNRVGALWTAYQLSKGVAPAQAFEEGRTAGMTSSLEQNVRTHYCKDCE